MLADRIAAVTIAVQILLGTATVWMVALLARRVIGAGTGDASRFSLWAAAAYALDPLSILYPSLLLTETLFTAVFVVHLLALLRFLETRAVGTAALAGVLAAVSTFVRPVAYFWPYRDSPSGDPAIRAEVSGERGQASGHVKDLSLQGAAIQFSVEQTTPFGSSERVTLVFYLQQERSVQVEAIVRTQTEMDGFWQFGFVFVAPSAIRAKLPAGLLRSFNERAAFRVEPSVTAPVEMQIPSLGFQASGRMRDISFDGLGVVTDGGTGNRLVPGLEVGVEFTLPGQERPLVCDALICNRRALNKGALLIGLRLEWKGSSEAASRRRNVTDYVMTRQRELLRARVGR